MIFLIDQINVSKIVHQFKNRLKIFLREIKMTLHFLVIKMRNIAAEFQIQVQWWFKNTEWNLTLPFFVTSSRFAFYKIIHSKLNFRKRIWKKKNVIIPRVTSKSKSCLMIWIYSSKIYRCGQRNLICSCDCISVRNISKSLDLKSSWKS